MIDEVVLPAPLADPGKDGRSSSKSDVAEHVQPGSSRSWSCGLGGGAIMICTPLPTLSPSKWRNQMNSKADGGPHVT